MGDDLKKVQRGEHFRMPAGTFNTFIDAARDYLQRRQGGGAAVLASVTPSGIVKVRNDTGADRALFEIVALGDPIFGPSDNLPEFEFRFAFKGLLVDEDHLGPWAILQEPLRAGAIGRAMVIGVSPVHVEVTDLAHHFAQSSATCGAAKLASAVGGRAEILWQEEGTGTKWALVRVVAEAPEPVRQLFIQEFYTATGAVWANLHEDGFADHAGGNEGSELDEEAPYIYIRLNRYAGEDFELGYAPLVEWVIAWAAYPRDARPVSGGHAMEGEALGVLSRHRAAEDLVAELGRAIVSVTGENIATEGNDPMFDKNGHYAIDETALPAGLKKAKHVPPTSVAHTVPTSHHDLRLDANGHVRAWQDSGDVWHWVGEVPPP